MNFSHDTEERLPPLQTVLHRPVECTALIGNWPQSKTSMRLKVSVKKLRSEIFNSLPKPLPFDTPSL